jgi:hypothetical protein
MVISPVPASPRNRMDEVAYQERQGRRDHQHDQLKRAGVGVIECNIVHGSRSYHEDYYSNDPASLRYTTHHPEFDVRWVLEMTGSQVDDLIDKDANIKYWRKNAQASESQLITAQAFRDRQLDTAYRLKKTLTENPGIKDQWDEMMVLLKMAGFSDKLT